MSKVVKLKKICLSCNKKMPPSKEDHCQECLDVFHKTWWVDYGEGGIKWLN